MANKANSELTEWSLLLNTLTPRGYLPAAGTPRRQVADFITNELRSRVRVEPTLYREGDLFTPKDIQELCEMADAAEPGAQEHIGRMVADAPPAAMDLLDARGVREKLSKHPDVALGTQAEALFLYYGHQNWVPLHLDDQVKYEFNLLTMLRRTRRVGAATTCTYFFGRDGLTARDLNVGESVFFHASFTPHGRPPLDEGEEVVLFAVGLGQ